MAVTEARSFDPTVDQPVDLGPVDEERLPDLLTWVRHHKAGDGYPAVNFERLDGTALTLATDGIRATLLWWLGDEEEPRNCVGVNPGDDFLVFDYFGSYSEVPSEYTVPLEMALDCTRRFLSCGIPESENVLSEAT